MPIRLTEFRSLSKELWNVPEAKADMFEAARLFPIPERNGQSIIAYAIRMFDVLYKRGLVQWLDISPMATADLAAQKAIRYGHVYGLHPKTKANVIRDLTLILRMRWCDCGSTQCEGYQDLVKAFAKKYKKHF